MHPNGLVGFGSYDGYGALPGVPAEVSPVTQADLAAALAERDRKNLQLTLMVGAGAALLSFGLAAMVLRR